MSLDLEAIKARHLTREKMENRTFYEGHIVIDLAALVEEVEYLRKERPAVVAYLDENMGLEFCDCCGQRSNEISQIANAIERGEHRREEAE
jgi:hypothetical protein